jgi:hypothetical protein
VVMVQGMRMKPTIKPAGTGMQPSHINPDYYKPNGHYARGYPKIEIVSIVVIAITSMSNLLGYRYLVR